MIGQIAGDFMILQFFSNIFKTKDFAPLSSSISTLQVILLLL